MPQVNSSHSNNPKSVINQPQLLPHIPSPRLNSSPLRRLRLPVIQILTPRLKSLQQHARVEESIYNKSQSQLVLG